MAIWQQIPRSAAQQPKMLDEFEKYSQDERRTSKN